ncbi:FAD-dependent oxidoreductase [Bryocella elongata]|nr:FAD-dependent oxidoreductase [Bryocella elongata]
MANLVVVGGGLAGVCCAITAAREGLSVVLVQDRPVLGGNSSSEVRLWVLGATSHMGNNNRWAREGGVIDEILVENMWRNPEGNPVIFDSVVLEKVRIEERITLLLNTSVHELRMKDRQTIAAVRAFNSQNQTTYHLESPLFVDASGDGILGFLAGAEFLMGCEARSEFDEPLAPNQPEHKLLGHSIYFYSKDAGRPVTYVPPAFALNDITRIPRYRDFRVSDTGCRLWWLEYGGNLDTVTATEEIKWELWAIAYGVWNYIKNSGDFPEAENLTLEWMGSIPGKRESRRFLGDVVITQNDIVSQTSFQDAVAYGGWAIDLHPSDGIFSAEPGCTQWHAKGVYQIPYRAMYSRNVANLFLAGRIISASHIAFGSTRVMATCGHGAQSVGMAAALCTESRLLPRDLLQPSRMNTLQQRLLAAGQHIPGVRATDSANLARMATITASSSLQLDHFPSSEEVSEPDIPVALLLPAQAGKLPATTLYARIDLPTTVRVELWTSSRRGNTTPDEFLEAVEIRVESGACVAVRAQFDSVLEFPMHVFLIVAPFAHGAMLLSRAQSPGVLMVSQRMNAAVAKSPVQTPPPGSGVDTFAFWLPARRPGARLLAATFHPPIPAYEPEMVVNGFSRPWCGTNAWAPAYTDEHPWLRLQWNEPQSLRRITLTFDTDYDHPMESVLLGHPERIMPGCIRSLRITTAEGDVLAHIMENHQTRFSLKLPTPIETKAITIEVLARGEAPPAIFEVSCR